MACFHPLEAWQLPDGKVVFQGTLAQVSGARDLWLPCGRCIGCRLVRKRSWAIRCLHEASMHLENCFVTLTYKALPSHADCDCEVKFPYSLCYKDFQRFMYRVRERLGPTRFFMCGEYGERGYRPHFHAVLFGRTFPDEGKVSEHCWRSSLLESLWPHGLSSCGKVTRESAAYVAGYTVSKRDGEIAEKFYERVDPETGEVCSVVPEFGRMSLKPGIGMSWFEKYWKEVYLARDGVCLPGGKVAPAPRFYDRMLERFAPDIYDDVSFRRYLSSDQFAKDCTPERLAVREKCAKLKERFLKRDAV